MYYGDLYHQTKLERRQKECNMTHSRHSHHGAGNNRNTTDVLEPPRIYRSVDDTVGMPIDKEIIVELLNPMQDAYPYQVKVSGDSIRRIVGNFYCGITFDKKISETFLNMLQVIAVSPHSILLSDMDELEHVYYGFKEYLHRMCAPYLIQTVGEESTELNPFKTKQLSKLSKEFVTDAHTLAQILAIFELALFNNFQLLFYGSFMTDADLV